MHISHVARNKGRFIIFLLFLAVLLIALICTSLPKQRWSKKATSPYKYAGSVWVSDDPKIVLNVPENNVSIEDSFAYLIWNNEIINIDICMDEKSTGILILDDENRNGSNSLIKGEIIKCTSDVFSFYVEEDHIFDGFYETITLSRVWDSGTGDG